MAVGDRTEARLGGPTALGTTTTVIATAAASRVEILKQIIITNTDTVDRTFSLAIGTAATAGNRIISQLPIGANDIMVLDTAMVLTAGETLQGLSDAASVVNVTVVGWEKEVWFPMGVSTPYGVQGLKQYVKVTKPTSIEYLLVGGGGASSASNGGGGGGAGVLTGTIAVLSNTTYTITVGSGGSGSGSTGANNTKGNNGNDTSAFSLTAGGGGAGNSLNNSAGGSSGRPSNGSGGGGSLTNLGITAAHVAGSGSGTGTSGGAGFGDTSSGGGGGAGGAGTAGTSTNGGSGGVGIQNSITGTSLYWAGGGGGTSNGTAGSGGLGGGGGGATNTGTFGTGGGSALNSGSNGGSGNGNDGGNGGANTGGGGGGSGCQMNGTADAIGANGGSGIVVVRYPSIYEAATVTGSSVAQSVSGGYRIYQFLASGSISW